MDKEKWVQFSEDADNDYQKLQENVINEKERGVENSPNMQLLKSIERAKNNLKIDPQFGIHIPRKVISKQTISRYGTNRLWKINLVGYWRLIYTIVGDEVKIISFVLEFMDHKKYDKVFGYRKK
jgi:aromatic ring-opening dioxygenase LigB subunit